jgi:ribose 5-phosphate isomerase B
MRVYLGSDHAGFELKNHLVAHLASLGHDVVDVGPRAYDADDDYPAFCLHTAARVVADPGSLGVVIGGSGNGEQIAANKVAGTRAALAWSLETAQLAREHNDANVVGIGARMHTPDEAIAIVTTFLDTPFSGGDRHIRRIQQIAEYERTRELPPLPA